MNCLAIDDEPFALKIIEDFVRKVPYLKLIGSYEDAYDAMEALRKGQVDLIFLDINMPDLTGTEFMQAFHNPPMVIFTTAYEQYAIEGFNLNAVDYLLKPIPFARFLKATDKALQHFLLRQKANTNASPGQTEEVALRHSSQKEQKRSFIFVNSEYQQVKVALADLAYIESSKDYLKLFLVGRKQPLTTLKSLKSIEAELPAEDFIRIHRSFIVSIPHIELVRNYKVKILEKFIPVGELYKAHFNQRVMGG